MSNPSPRRPSPDTTVSGPGEEEKRQPEPGDLLYRSEWETSRAIPHEEALEIARRLIASHFRRTDTEQARVGIPARPDYDDDLLISTYIKQQARRDALFNTQPPSRSSGGGLTSDDLRDLQGLVSSTSALLNHTNPFDVNEAHSQQWFAVHDCIVNKIEPLLYRLTTLPHSDREGEGRDPKGSGHAPEAEPHARLGATPACPSRKPDWIDRAAWCAAGLLEALPDEWGEDRASDDDISAGTGIPHLRWMARQLVERRLTSETKACRWLGWLQAGAVYCAVTTLEGEKQRNQFSRAAASLPASPEEADHA